MHRRCPPRPPVPFVDTLDAAVHVVDASVGGAPFATLVLLLDADDRLLTVVALTDPPGGVDGLVSACVALLDAAGATRWRSTVLASDRSGRGALADASDRSAWHELRRASAGAGVALVDWLLLDGDVVGSVAGQVDGVDVWSGR